MSVTPTKPVGAVDSLDAESPSGRAAAGEDLIPLLLAVNPGIVVNYKRMAALDPKHRTWSSWEHKFRKLKARGKELAAGAAKAEGETSKAAGDVEESVILLIAANPGITFNYKEIAALDLQGRTFYSWEHRFRKWRASAKELAEEAAKDNGEKEDNGDDAPIKKAKKARAKVKQVAPINVINDDNGCDKQAPRKAAANATTDDQGSNVKEEDVSNGEAAVAKVNSGKKRQEATEDAVDGSPTKRARASKKGTARVVKKSSKKPTEIDEEVPEDIDSDEIAKQKGKERSGGKTEEAVVKDEIVETQGEGVKLEHEI